MLILDWFVVLFVVFKGLEDESSNCTRQTLVGLNVCLKYLVESESCEAVIPLLQELPLVAKNPYWLVKVSFFLIILYVFC